MVRHRKVYLAETTEKPPTIHTIKLHVPIIWDEPADKPQQLYKMHEYTVHEPVSEVQMVPYETTIIKPAGVQNDQIIS